MIVVFGSTLYGKVRAVPGVCHVATRFLHFFFVPLFPTGAWLVIHERARAQHGVEGLDGAATVKLPAMNWASVCLGWLRFFLVTVLFVLAIVIATKIGLDRPWSQTLPLLVAAATCVAAFIGSYRLLPASSEHIEALQSVRGIPPLVLTRAREQLARRP